MFNRFRTGYEGHIKLYESSLSDELPRWVRDLDRQDAIRLLRTACRLNWRLPSDQTLIEDPITQSKSLWSREVLWVDLSADQMRGWESHWLDLMCLPADPATVAAKSYLGKGNEKWGK